MIPESKLRALATKITRQRIADDEPIEQVVCRLDEFVAMLEAAWFHCHARHLDLEPPLEAIANSVAAVQKEVQERALVAGLCGAGFCFSQNADYEMALDLAVRAYREGLAGRTLSDQIREAVSAED